MHKYYRVKTLLFTGIAFAATGCQPAATNNSTVVAINSNTVSANSAAANANSMAVNANSAGVSVNSNGANANVVAANGAGSSVTIDTREPENYQAAVNLKVETMGEGKAPNLPNITAQVARSGANRRMEFSLPNGEKVIYLDTAGKHFLISPNRKQYAELNQESLGVEVRNLMTPAQIVQQLKGYKGVEQIGEETINGRAATKYRYNAVTDTKSTAGNVATESFVFVDKETGLPLRSETVSQSQNVNVKGVSGIKLVTEMSGIKTNAAPDLFNEPTEYKKVAPEEVRSQVNQIFSIGLLLLNQIMQTSQKAN